MQQVPPLRPLGLWFVRANRLRFADEGLVDAGATGARRGKPGVAGNVLVPLCAPCKSGVHGTKTVSGTIAKEIEAGKTYVNVHTAKNPAGEIRGQIKATS